MDFELKHLGQTLAIGGLTIYALLYLLRICRKEWIPQFFRAQCGNGRGLREKNSNVQLEHTALYLSLILAAGIVVEDFSKFIVSGREEHRPNPCLWDRAIHGIKEFINNEVLDKDSELRLKNLFSGDLSDKHTFADNKVDAKKYLCFRPRGLFWEMSELIYYRYGTVAARRSKAVLDLMENENHEKVFVPGMGLESNLEIDSLEEIEKEQARENQDYFVRETLTIAELEAAKKSKLPLPTYKISKIESFRAAVNELYYNAKNLVYTNENYFKELSDIQERIDFSRTLTLLCMVFTIVYFVFTLMAFKEKSRSWLDICPKEKRYLPALTVIFLFGTYFVGAAYRSEASNHDKRVFGYYISMELNKDTTPSGSARLSADPPAAPAAIIATAAPAVKNLSP